MGKIKNNGHKLGWATTHHLCLADERVLAQYDKDAYIRKSGKWCPPSPFRSCTEVHGTSSPCI